jgi:queuosine precursor transporter
MVPEALSEFLAAHQNTLWLLTVVLDLSMTLVLFKVFGKMGLYAVVVLDIMLCNLVGPKITMIFGMNTSLGVVIYSGIYFATDLLGERYGKREANRAVFIGFAVSILVIVFCTLSLMFLPATSSDPEKQAFITNMHGALKLLFGFTPRFVIGSLLAYLLSQTHDVWMFHFLREKTKGKHLWLRNNVSTITSQAIDTVVYGIVVWGAIFDLRTAFELALAKYVFKVIIALVDTPFIYWARTWDVRGRDWNATLDSEE